MKKTTENEGFLAIFPCFFQPSVCVPAPSEEKVHDCHLTFYVLRGPICTTIRGSQLISQVPVALTNGDCPHGLRVNLATRHGKPMTGHLQF